MFFEWFNDGNIMIAFSEGYFIGISTKIDVRSRLSRASIQCQYTQLGLSYVVIYEQEVGEELFSSRYFTDRIFAAAYSPQLNRTAISGDNGIKIVDMGDYKEVLSDTIKLTDAEVRP